MSLLAVEDLAVRFPVRNRWLGGAPAWVRAVAGVSFSLAPAQTLGLVGESGCGKTTLGRAVTRLVPLAAGRIRLEGEDITALRGAELRQRRRVMQMVFQDPYSSLDPRMTVAQIVGEALDIHRLETGRKAKRARVAGLLDSVGLSARQMDSYPHEFSGGQRQRIGIARALAVEPRLIVCDEPVSALDVSVQAQIVNLLQDLQKQRGLAYLFIAHDLAVVEHISHRVLVMYLGKVVEEAEARELLRRPVHPYTQALIAAAPSIDPESRRPRLVLKGEVPSPIHPPPGCPFHPRCPLVEPRCRIDPPKLREVGAGHLVSCHLAAGREVAGDRAMAT